MKNNDIEDLFKKSFENYEQEVSPGVWKNIRIGLKWGSLALLFNMILNKLGTNAIIALLTSAVAVISTVAIVNWAKTPADKTQSVQNETNLTTTTKVETTVSINKADNNVQLNTVEQNGKNEKADDLNVNNNEQKTGLAASNLLVEKTMENNKNSVSVTNNFSDKSISSISANPLVGTAPLIVNLANIGKGKTNKWKFSGEKNENATSNPVHIFEKPGVYSVILTSISLEGKKAIDSVTVEVTGNSSASSAPIEFSPNGDGVLDVLSFNLKFIAKLNAKIFDKKGTVVYKSERTDGKWDGKDLQGKDVEQGTYFYIINAEGLDGKKYEPKGSINLTR